jgi:hypothetical protein
VVARRTPAAVGRRRPAAGPAVGSLLGSS